MFPRGGSIARSGDRGVRRDRRWSATRRGSGSWSRSPEPSTTRGRRDCLSPSSESGSASRTARFNYHLEKLQDTFVTKIEDRYVARAPGLRVVTSMCAGRYDDTTEAWTVGAPSNCNQCGDPLLASHERRQFGSELVSECPEHGQYDRLPLPPGTTDGREPSEAVRVAYRYTMLPIRMAHAGICFECLGPTTVTYPVDPITATVPEDRIPIRISCDRCWLSTFEVEPPASGSERSKRVARRGTRHGVTQPAYHDRPTPGSSRTLSY